MPQLPFDRLVSQPEAVELGSTILGITLYELPSEAGYTMGLQLPERTEVVFIATQRRGSQPREWSKVDVALRFIKQVLGYRGSVGIEMARVDQTSTDR